MNSKIVGIWKLKSVRQKTIEGTWNDEEILGGTCVYHESGSVVLFYRTSETMFGYSGKFEMKDNNLKTLMEVCINPELEGKYWERNLKFNADGSQFSFSSTDRITGLDFEGTWERVKTS